VGAEDEQVAVGGLESGVERLLGEVSRLQKGLADGVALVGRLTQGCGGRFGEGGGGATVAARVVSRRCQVVGLGFAECQRCFFALGASGG